VDGSNRISFIDPRSGVLVGQIQMALVGAGTRQLNSSRAAFPVPLVSPTPACVTYSFLGPPPRLWLLAKSTARSASRARIRPGLTQQFGPSTRDSLGPMANAPFPIPAHRRPNLKFTTRVADLVAAVTKNFGPQ
jgi:hypothetical protein